MEGNDQKPAIRVIIRSKQPTNRYGRYVGEMLKSEGISDFQITDIDIGLSLPILGSDIVLLTRSHLRRSETAWLLEYARAGGVLAAFQPPWRFCEELGLVHRKLTTFPAYLLPSADHPATRGLPQESIQTHLPIEMYDCSAAVGEVTALAFACAAGADTPLHPAAVAMPVGAGTVVVFFYDPPAAVARIRFGDPDLADISTASMRGDPRSTDLFTHQIDASRMYLPQADIHCAFLANVLTHVSPRPLPRLWHYPRAEQRSVLALRSDGDHSTPEQFEMLREAVERRGGRCTFYLTRDTRLPDSVVRKFSDRGHSFSIHSNPHTGEDPYFTMDGILEDDIQAFRSRYGVQPRTTQVHSAYWRGHMDLIPTYYRLGLRLAVTVGAFGPRLGNCLGRYLAGSCRPMKFVSADGRIHDVFQMPYNIFDDASLRDRLSTQPGEELVRAAKAMDDCVNVHFSPVGFQSHPVSFATYASPYIGGVMDEGQKRGIPVTSMEDWYAFTQARYDAALSVLHTCDNAISCRLAAKSTCRPLSVMLPLSAGRECRTAAVNGRATDTHDICMFGIRYVSVDVDAPTEQADVAFNLS